MKTLTQRSHARDDAGFNKTIELKSPVQAVQPEATGIAATIVEGLGRINCCTPLRVLPHIPTELKEV